jgi:glycolate oxidase
VIWFDRYTKLRDEIRAGRLHTQRGDMLPLLKGKLSRDDLPAIIIEPANLQELSAALRFASEKKMKVAVGSGLTPVEIHALNEAMLILTTRLSGSPVFSASRQSVRVDAGLPVESLAIDLQRAARRWMPLLPTPSQMSLGQLVAMGWEGERNWNCGMTLSHVRAIEWMSFEGNGYRTGMQISDGTVDVRGFLFGSRGALGIITAVELELQAMPSERTAMVFELPDAKAAEDILLSLRSFQPLAEAVTFWGETATRLIFEGNDGRLSDQTKVVVVAEWSGTIEKFPAEWSTFASPIYDDEDIARLWQDLQRSLRTATRLYPSCAGARLKIPTTSLSMLEEAARDFGREFNLPIALRGTVEFGHFDIRVLQPDGQQRTCREAEEALKKMVEVALSCGGAVAPGTVLPFGNSQHSTSFSNRLYAELRRRCDPANLYCSLN